MRAAGTAIALLVSLILAAVPAFEIHAQEPDPEPGLAPPPEPEPTPTSFYLLAGGGACLTGDTDVTANGATTSVETKLDYGGLAAFGVDFGDNVRTELEFGYRRLGIDSVGNTTGTGDIAALSAMGNLVFDFANSSPITPYAGLGLGAARIDHHNVSPVSGSRLNDGDYVFALQGLAGVSLKVSNAISFFTDYRYMATGDTKLTDDSGARFDGAFSEHRFTLGLRWSFGGPDPKKKREPKPVSLRRPGPQPAPVATRVMPATPPPPPDIKPPVPMTEAEPKAELEPAAPSFERVLFQWNSSDITPEAQAKIDALVSNLKPETVIRIDATGHADRSGSAANNQIISRRRAMVVKKELMRQGVPEDWIKITWKGEAEPVVATPNGVRHPANRRVDIVIDSDTPPSQERISRR